MAATMTTMAILNAKCMNINSPKITNLNPKKPISLLSIPNLPTGLIPQINNPSVPTSLAIAGAVFSTLSTSDAAFAAQQLAELAESGGGSDNRGLALLLPIIPAIAWVLFNILQPALNQINKMRNTKVLVLGVGLSGLGLLNSVPDASALGGVHDEIAVVGAAAAEAAGADNRGQLLLFVVAPAILWVLYNILQPALNQINKMRSQ